MRVVVIDPAPTGHHAVAARCYAEPWKEVERTQGEVAGAVAHLLPRLRVRSGLGW